MEAKPYFDALNQALGLELSPSPTGSLAFQLEGWGLILQWLEEARAFILYAELGSLAGWGEREICRTLLGANFLLVETQGASLSLDSSKNVVGLNYYFPVYGQTGEGFVNLVDNFVEMADYWRGRLAALNAEQEERVRVALATQEEPAAEEAEESFSPPAMIRI